MNIMRQPWREILQEHKHSESLSRSKSYSSIASHQTPKKIEMSKTCTSNSRTQLLGETITMNVASGTGEGDIINMITLRKYKIKVLRRAFLAKENEGDGAKVITRC